MTETIMTAVALIPALVIAIVFHEVAHGYVAKLLGDPTASQLGRLTLNPIRHVDLFGTLILPGMLALAGWPVFGYAKPVPVNKRRLNNPRFGMMAVAAAGPATNLVLAAIGAVLGGLLSRYAGVDGAGPESSGLLGLAFMTIIYFILINVSLALFNLLPIPPFDGSHIVEGLLPPDLAKGYARLRPYGFALIVVLLLVIPNFFPEWGIVEKFVLPPVLWLQDWFFQLADWVAGNGGQ